MILILSLNTRYGANMIEISLSKVPQSPAKHVMSATITTTSGIPTRRGREMMKLETEVSPISLGFNHKR